jgi:hypothetical protein
MLREVRLLLSDPRLLGSCKEPLDAQAVGNMMYSMKF